MNAVAAPDTGYLLRQPGYDELRVTFGTLDYAYRTTGGDIPTLCFFIANPDRVPVIEPDESAPHARGGYADQLKEAAAQEHIVRAFREQPKPTLVATAAASGRSTYMVRKVLTACGLWPIPS